MNRLEVIALRDMAVEYLPAEVHDLMERNGKFGPYYRTMVFSTLHLETSNWGMRTAVHEAAAKLAFLTTRHPDVWTPPPTMGKPEIEATAKEYDVDRYTIEQALAAAALELCKLSETTPPKWLQELPPSSKTRKATPAQERHLQMFERLTPRTVWRGGRVTEVDPLELDEAAELASRHAGEQITAKDFLRAGARGEILLRAIIHRSAKVERFDNTRPLFTSSEGDNIALAGAVLTLPQIACNQLAVSGRARWRTFDGFQTCDDGTRCRYTEGWLTDDEPDFETTPGDCRVLGYDVHALADGFANASAQGDVVAPAPVAGGDQTSKLPLDADKIISDVRNGTETRWTPEKIEEARTMQARLKVGRVKDYTAQTAAHYNVTTTRLREVLRDASKKKAGAGYKSTIHRIS